MTLQILLLLSSFLGVVQAFSPAIPFQTSFLTSAEKSSGICWELYASDPPVSVVSVCTAELCCCQEEGGSAIEILDNLNSRNLPYPIEEAPCLGACGGGAMVAIDFEDGSAALVSGIEETLSELGLSSSVSNTIQQRQEEDIEIPIGVKTVINQNSVEPELIGSTTKPIAVVEAENDVTSQEYQSSVPSQVVATLEPPPPAQPEVSSESSNNSPTYTSTKQYKMSSDDVRERMRAEAASDNEQINPWMNMASYLAGKARDKILGTEED